MLTAHELSSTKAVLRSLTCQYCPISSKSWHFPAVNLNLNICHSLFYIWDNSLLPLKISHILLCHQSDFWNIKTREKLQRRDCLEKIILKKKNRSYFFSKAPVYSLGWIFIFKRRERKIWTAVYVMWLFLLTPAKCFLHINAYPGERLPTPNLSCAWPASKQGVS